VEERYAVELLSGQTSGVGYLLKQRVADVRDFLDALERVASGGRRSTPRSWPSSSPRARRHPQDELTPREHEVLALMARGSRTRGSRGAWS
jgi:DNA-binding NarL/FixJ family response regulator